MRKINLILALMIGLIATVNLQAQDDLSAERKQAIDSLALEKVRDLSKYISIIGSKSTPWSEANRVIDRAEELFMLDAEIGVSSLARPEIDYYKVRQYFERLMRLNYDRVEIDWFKIEYVSDLQRQPDGTYVGVITIFQKFKAYDKEGGLVYEDTTKKDITIYVKRKETQIGGRIIGFWDVLLGDMRVKETSK
ncbi:MAG: hypothetical protein KJ578_06415 [Bacteroidetes bacterium]|jgi:hypothetical protein|nr:hypothetical protein [Bacteroidota bacterium]MDA3944856.1 hypothetical protein [Bacteroidota bacterium]